MGVVEVVWLYWCTGSKTIGGETRSCSRRTRCKEGGRRAEMTYTKKTEAIEKL